MERRHFAAAHFMQNFSRLGIRLRIGGLRLIGGKALQHAAGDARIDPQHLHGGDEAVAAKRRRIPGSASIRISPFGRVRRQHMQVSHRPAQHLIENLIRGLNGGRVRGRRF